MRVGQLNNFYRIAFKSKVTDVMLGKAPQELKDKIDRFEEKHDNATFLGEGLFARAYLFNGTNIVIKESLKTEKAKKTNSDFSQEAKYLAKLPSNLTNSQKLIANVKTEKGNYYLLSTLVNGVKPDNPTGMWEKEHFASLFRGLFELDKNKIFHGDINRGNCLISENGNANLIDYQYAEDINISNTSKNDEMFKVPPFMAPANSYMFEMANLPFYLSKLSDTNQKNEVKDVFVTYLKEKSEYYKNRTNMLRFQKASNEMIEYEQLQSKFLKNPSEKTIDVEALKLQTLYSFRQVFSITDKNSESKHNIIATIPYYLYTAACAKKLIDSAQKYQNSSSDESFKKLMDYEIKFGKYWQDKMLEDLSGSKFSSDGEYGSYKWIKRNVMLDPHWKNEKVDPEDDLSEKLKKSIGLEIGNIDDVAFKITGKNDVKSKESYVWGIYETKQEFYKIDKLIKESFDSSVPGNSSFKRDIVALNTIKNSFINSYNQAFQALEQQRIIACVPTSLKALYYATVLKKAANNLYEKTYNSQLLNYSSKQKNLALGAQSSLEKITDQLYKRALSGIDGSDSNLIDSVYYEKLNEFDLENCEKYDYNKPLKFRNDM